MRYALALVVLAGLASAPHPAAAQANEIATKRAEAKPYHVAGVDAAKKGRFDDAIDAFEAGIAIIETDELVYGLAFAHASRFTAKESPADLKRAIALFRRYLDIGTDGVLRTKAVAILQYLEPQWNRLVAEGKATNDPAPAPVQKPKTQLMLSSQTPGAQAALDGGALGDVGVAHEVTPGPHKVRVVAPGFIAQEVTSTAVDGRLIVATLDLQPKAAQVAVKAPPDATITVNGRKSGREFEVPAGEYIVSVTKRGHAPVSQSIAVARGQTIALDARMHKTTQRKVSYYFLGGASVLAVGGAVTAVVAVSAQGEAEDLFARIGTDPLGPSELTAYDDASDRRDTYRTVSYVLFGTAAAAAVTGGLLYWFDTPRPEGATPIRTVVPTATNDSVGAAYTGTF